jgi:hypothetical protein
MQQAASYLILRINLPHVHAFLQCFCVQGLLSVLAHFEGDLRPDHHIGACNLKQLNPWA